MVSIMTCSRYRQAALTAHPDKGGCSADFQRITAAFETLSNPAARDAYDRHRIKIRSKGLLVVNTIHPP